MDSPALSVAMSVYNGEAFLDEAIQSILDQSFGDFEFLIVDDGSTDRTPSIIEAHAQLDSRIRPIIRENRGLVASLNQLLAEARAPIVARMDADDICLPERFERQMAFLKANPDFGVVGAWTDDIGSDGRPYHLKGQQHPTNHADFLSAIEENTALLCHPVVMYRRDTVLSVGGYHAAFRHCEDYDLWLRLANITHIASLPERLIRYRHYEGQVSSRHLTEQQIGVVVAKTAYEERKAGRPDPTEALTTLPPIDELDALFGRPSISAKTRAHVASAIRYSRPSLRGEGFDILIDHIAKGGRPLGRWRLVARLCKFGQLGKAAKLAATLCTSPTLNIKMDNRSTKAQELKSRRPKMPTAQPMKAPTITVAMSVYNNACYLNDAVESIRQQSFTNFEFLIVDDGSNDGSDNILNEKASQDSRIRILSQENRGLIRSLNRLIEESRGTWIARMDGDDISHRDRFSLQLEFVTKNPGYVAVGSNNTLIDNKGCQLGYGGEKPLTQPDIQKNLEYGPIISHPAALIHAATLRSIGGYRGAYHYCEDYDLWLRLSERGMLGNCPENLVQYRVYPEQISQRHVVEQAANAAIAWLAYQIRSADKIDPTNGLTELPNIDQLDEFFRCDHASRYVRRRILETITYDTLALSSNGYPVLIDQVKFDGIQPNHWRIVARLMKAGRIKPAIGIMNALLRKRAGLY